MTIIKKEKNADGVLHSIEEQPHNQFNWIGDEWIEVPANLKERVWACLGFCDLVIENDTLVDIIEKEPPFEFTDEYRQIKASLDEAESELSEVFRREALDAAVAAVGVPMDGIQALGVMAFGGAEIKTSAKQDLIGRIKDLRAQLLNER